MDIKLYKSPWRAIKLILLCSIFVLGGIFMLKNDGPKGAAWLCIGFFGLGYPLGLIQLLDRRPQIIINEFGIFDRTAYKDFINWEVIYDAYPLNITGQKFVCLVVDENYTPSRKKGRFFKTMVEINKGLGAQELNIFLGQIIIDEVKLTKFIQAMISLRPEDRREKLKEKLLKS